MSEIQHKSLKDELLYLIGRASAPLSSADLYEKCELADEVAKVAKAVANLQSDGKIVRVTGEGRARYTLAPGVDAPAPAGKTGRSKAVQKDDAARGAAQTPPAAAAGIEIPTLGTAAARKPKADRIVVKAVPITGLRPAAEPSLPAIDIPPHDDAEIAQGLDQVEQHLSGAGKADAPGADASRLADAIIARLKRQLAPSFVGMDLADGLDRIAVHIHIEQIDFHLGGL